MRVDVKAVGKNKDTFKLSCLDDNAKTVVAEDSDSDFMSTIWGKRLPGSGKAKPGSGKAKQSNVEEDDDEDDDQASGGE